MSHSLLISDIHLSEARPDLCAAFSRYCRTTARQADELFILGDLADAWIGDDDDSSTAALIRDELSAITASGVRVYLMVGNRDFLMGKQLADTSGINLLPDPSIQSIQGHQILLLHGDAMCIDDQEYMAFRAQIQNPQMQQMLLAKPIEERRQIAAMIRAKSKSANATKAADIMDVNQAEVEKAFDEHKVCLMIHGHTHRPDVHNISLKTGEAKRYVLGDWDTKGWQIKIDVDNIELSSFSLSED